MINVKQSFAAALFCVLGSAAHAQLPDYSAYFTMTSPYWQSESVLRIDGVRVNGLGLTINDAVDLIYTFRPSDASLVFSDATVTFLAGVTAGGDSWMTSVDASPPQPYVVATGAPYAMMGSQTYQVTGCTAAVPLVLTVQLGVGHVASWNVLNPTGDFTYSFASSSGAVLSTYDGTGSYGVIAGAIRIKKADTYTLTVAPRASTSSFNFSLQFWNANNRRLDTLATGSLINDVFADNIRDYSKHVIPLQAGQFISLPSPTDSNISMALVDSYSRSVRALSGLPLNYTAVKTDNYYLFIYNQKGWGGSYSGRAFIYGTAAGQAVPEKSDQHSRHIYDSAANPAPN